MWKMAGWRPGFRSNFAPPDALPRGTGRDEWEREVTVGVVGGLVVQLMPMVGDE
jgi:hypothetical protein